MTRLACLLLSSACCALAFQASTTPNVQDVLVRITKAKAAVPPDTAQIQRALDDYALISAMTKKAAVAFVEENRLDKQPGAGPAASGSTSLVSRGSVPALLGLAVENGGLTRAINGTTITFRGRPANILKALAVQDYLSAAIGRDSPFWLQAINKLSGSVSFDTNRSGPDSIFTAQREQVSGYSVRLDLWNNRDPRNAMYSPQWIALRGRSSSSLVTVLTELALAFNTDSGFIAWRASTLDSLVAAPPAQVVNVLAAAGAQLVTLLEDPAATAPVKGLVTNAQTSWDAFVTDRNALLNSVFNTPVVAIDYALVRQTPSTTAGVTPAGVAAPSQENLSPAPATTPSALPDLGTVRLIADWPLKGGAIVTFNASVTAFDNTFRRNRLRDYQFSAQLDAPAGKIAGLGQTGFSLSALYLNLLDQPIGQQVTVNGMPIDSRGALGFVQAKWELPFGSSGLKMPIALTYASRHELLANERNKLGANIGLTFDLDRLLSAK